MPSHTASPRTADKQLRGVVFDIDGTLVSASFTHLQAIGEAAEHVLGVEAKYTLVDERPYLNGMLVSGWVDAQCLQLLATQAGLDWAAVREETLECYARLYEELLEKGAPPGELIPGVAAMLDTLSAAGAPMGLSTGNTAAVAELKLAALGVDHYFNYSVEAGFSDLHTHRTQVAAAAVAAIPPAQTIYLIGDTTADMKAATSNGVVGVGVITGADTGPVLLEAGASLVLADATEMVGLFGLNDQRWFPKHVPGVVSATDLWMDYR